MGLHRVKVERGFAGEGLATAKRTPKRADNTCLWRDVTTSGACHRQDGRVLSAATSLSHGRLFIFLNSYRTPTNPYNHSILQSSVGCQQPPLHPPKLGATEEPTKPISLSSRSTARPRLPASFAVNHVHGSGQWKVGGRGTLASGLARKILPSCPSLFLFPQVLAAHKGS